MRDARLTEVNGLLPILLEAIAHADAIKPLLVSVVFNLLTSPVLGLFILQAVHVF